MYVVKGLNIKLSVFAVLLQGLVSIGKEVLPIYVTNNYLYLGVDAGDGYGGIYRYDLSSGDLEEVWFGEGARFSQVAIDHISNRVVVVGLGRDSEGLPRSAVFVFNPSSEGVDVVTHQNTDEINMFRSVVYDHVYRRFIVGERGYGTDASRVRSVWPNGGGLWVIPYEGLFDYTRWVRVHEFPNNPEVTSIALHTDNNVYVGLWRAGVVSKVVRSNIAGLTSWGDFSTGNVNVRHFVDSEGRVFTYSRVLNSGDAYIYWFTDLSSSYVFLGNFGGGVGSVDVKLVGRYVVVAVGKPSLSATDVYLVDRNNNTYRVVQSNVSGLIEGKRFLYDGRKNLYIGSVNSAGNAKVYRLSFDYGRVLMLNVSPSVVRVGGTVTLTAVLRDESGNPVAGATVEFYVAHSTHGSVAGHRIGSQITNSSGVASMTYTAPVSPARLMFFAIYHG
jgi:hypothetical protein